MALLPSDASQGDPMEFALQGFGHRSTQRGFTHLGPR